MNEQLYKLHRDKFTLLLILTTIIILMTIKTDCEKTNLVGHGPHQLYFSSIYSYKAFL